MSEQPVGQLNEIVRTRVSEVQRFPYFPFKHNRSLSLRSLYGPYYSISLSCLECYHDYNTDMICRNTLCADIIDKALDMSGVILHSSYTVNTVIDLNDAKYTLLKIHILEAIECFKFAIARGYPYHYERKNVNGNHNRGKYSDLKTIIKLSYMDLPVVRDFIAYYFSLFPNIGYDFQVSVYIVEKSIKWAIHLDTLVNIKVLTVLFDIYKTTNLRVDTQYYHILNKMMDNDFYHDIVSYKQIVRLVQFGIDYGIKADIYNIEFINNRFGHKVTFHLDLNLDKNLYLYRKLKPDRIRNHEEWFNQERGDIYYSNIIKTTFVINEITKQTGTNLVNTNLAHLSSIIDKYY